MEHGIKSSICSTYCLHNRHTCCKCITEINTRRNNISLTFPIWCFFTRYTSIYRIETFPSCHSRLQRNFDSSLITKSIPSLLSEKCVNTISFFILNISPSIERDRRNFFIRRKREKRGSISKYILISLFTISCSSHYFLYKTCFIFIGFKSTEKLFQNSKFSFIS